MDYMTITELTAFIEGSTWHFAKTMPEIPHYYVRKRECDSISFLQFVKYQTTWGVDRHFGRKMFRYLVLGEWQYWTMGYGQQSTIINRAKIEPVGYDKIPTYDSLFQTEEYISQDNRLIKLLNDLGALEGMVLDIGCGAGLLADRSAVTAGNYRGIDPSFVQLKAFVEKHPEYDSRLLCAGIEEINRSTSDVYDSIVSTFGSASYAGLPAILESRKFLAPGGVEAHVFFNEGYQPLTHVSAGKEIPFYRVTREELEASYDKVIPFDEYYVATYKKSK